MRRQWVPLAALAFALGACDPYERFVGDESAGAVDPVNFPKAYLGEGGDPKMTGQGVINAVPATVGGETIGYYSFPFTTMNEDGTADLSLSVGADLLAPLAYDFDEDGGTHCVAPDNYLFDQQRDAVRFDQQGNIFTTLPDAEGYAPVVADVVVRSKGLPCQEVKSETRLVERDDVQLDLIPAKDPNLPDAHPTGKPSGHFFARPIIDPSSDVRLPDGSLDPNTGLGPQKWGWYQRYLLAYLDGGEIPVFETAVDDGMGGKQNVTTMIEQALYFPTKHPGMDSSGNPVAVDGALAEGFDVLEFKRGDKSYSPLCRVFSFDPADPLNPETDVKQIDKKTVQPTGEYVWCIQVQP